MKFEGSILGFNYEIELADEAAFEVWIEAKIRRYLLKDGHLTVKVLKKVLGLDVIKSRLLALENA